MSSDVVLKASHVGKCFQIYDKPNDRLIQSFYSLACRLCPIPHWRIKLQKLAQNCARQYWALNDVSFELKRGETIGIIGRNGSGKSTLLQLLCGILNPTTGSVTINGRVAALLELGSGFNPEYSGRDNIYMNGQLLGLSRDEIDSRLEEIIAFADIGDFIEQPVKTYSSGMFVRLAFAVIAHVDADILVIDEALAVGDAFFTQKCMRFLRKFMERGSILFVSHDTVAVKSLCERALWIDKGLMLFDGSAKEASDKYLQNFYENTNYETVDQKRNSPSVNALIKLPKKDARLEWLNLSNLRNDIQAFEFDQNVDRYGSNEARIEMINFLDASGAPLTWIVGGEDVKLKVDAVFHKSISSPIIGFYVKDRLGQVLFGDNTYLTYHDTPLSISAGQKLVAEFQFQMPILLKGDYSVCVAIAAGSNQDHTPLDWINEAVILKSESSSVVTGLVGVAMQKIELSAIAS